MPNLKSTALLALLFGCALNCASPGVRPDYTDYPVSWPEMLGMLRHEQTTLATFERLGPFETRLQKNLSIQIGTQTVAGDLVSPKGAPEAPLAIIVHGNRSHKEAHRFQAIKLASFGIYAFVVQLPSEGHWRENALIVEALARKIHAAPGVLNSNIDPSAIVLAGHSFGGSTVSLAAGNGAPVKGLVLLDPAIFSPEVAAALGSIRQPVMLLGSDRTVFRARKRALFGRQLRGEFGEVSVTGSTHDDAQSPSMYSLSAFGLDPYTSPSKQTKFSAALTAAVIAIAADGNLKFAWQAYQAPLASGVLKDAVRRTPKTARAASISEPPGK